MRSSFLAALIIILSSLAHGQDREIFIPAVPYDRNDVTGYIPIEDAIGSQYELVNKKTGKIIPAQYFAKNKVVLYLENLSKGDSARYILRRSTRKFEKPVRIEKSDNGLLVKVKGRPVFFYHTKEAMPPVDSPAYYRRSGFIHPLYSPSGNILTDGFPAGHTHQHGIFMAWVNTTFRGQKVDFWNQHQQTGTVQHSDLVSVEEGPVFASIVTKLKHMSLVHGAVLEETWTLIVLPFNDEFEFHLISEQQNITADTLFINKYHYGGLAYRGSREWNTVDSAHFKNKWSVITSEGKDNQTANHTRAEWVTASGLINGKKSGVRIYGHPNNFRSPQMLRVHPEMPYLVFAPMVEDGFSIAPGETYLSMYVFRVFDGQPKELKNNK